jgi:hypothetical protein
MERLKSSLRVGDAQMSRIGDREAVVPREKPPHPYSPVGGFMFYKVVGSNIVVQVFSLVA